MSLPFLYEAIFQSKDVIYISSANHQKQKILIVDDSEMNRSILADMLVLSDAMGNQMYMATFRTKREMDAFYKDVLRQK